MVAPEFKVVCLDETQHYTDKALVEKCGKIRAVFVYDKSRATHCCEITPSYELRYIGSSPDEVADDDDVYDSIQEANAHREATQYMHCSVVDKIPSKYHVAHAPNWKPMEEDYATEEAYEELFQLILEDEQANPNF